MKLLVSDYDGTIKTYDKNPNMIERYVFRENIKAINNFCEDNKFVVATGRNIKSIYDETKKHKILYDYLIGYNGRVIVNKDNKIINAEYIDYEFLNELDYVNIKDLSLYDEFKLNNNIDKPIYIYLKLYKDIKDNIIYWKEKYPHLEISYNYIFNTIIIRKKYNKSHGINKLLEIEDIDIEKKNIITVGDETNDREMIKYYNGYRMFLSNPKLWFTTKKVTPTVYKLIKKIK